jgi:hypothetical protein
MFLFCFPKRAEKTVEKTVGAHWVYSGMALFVSELPFTVLKLAAGLAEEISPSRPRNLCTLSPDIILYELINTFAFYPTFQ